MAHEFRMQRRVAFAETDMAGIVHFSNFFRYMEEVEHAFFRSLGLRVHGHVDAMQGWARLEATCSYRAPLRYEDVVELHLSVREKRSKSIRYEIVFRRPSDEDPDTVVEAARGSVTAVCVRKDGERGPLRAVCMPPEVDSQIETAPNLA